MPTPDPPSLPRLFAGQVARTPDAPAVTDGRLALTYRELDAWSSRLADVLRRDRPAPGRRIGIYLERGTEQVVAVLAVLKAGCAYVPLDPAYPRERVRHMARDAAADVVVTDRDPSAVLPAARAVALDETPLSGEAGAAERLDVEPDTPAYVIYTSGSSGVPKGVVVTHANVLAFLDAAARAFDLGCDDTWALFHSCCFDFSVWEMWGALSRGARLAVLPAGVARSPEATLAFLAEHRVTVLNQVPSVFRHLVTAAADLPGGPPPLALRRVFLGGEPLTLASVRTWRRLYGDAVAFVHVYGITETTVLATHRPLPASDAEDTAADPERTIGVPLDGVEIELLDDGARVPDGAVGEIHIAGPQVAVGYLNRPELTAARYPVLDPGRDGRARRWYASGDLARRLPDGALSYAGRADDQVKVNGYRIELGEVEAALRGADGVRDVVVVAARGRAGDLMLVAFYARDDGDGGDDDAAARLAAHGQTTLPGYMIPGRFVAVPAIPIGPSGKADRRALAEAAR